MAIFGSVPSVPTTRHERSSQIADDIDFEIKGTEMQFVEIELDPGESAIAEAGSMMFKGPDIEMETVFGDGSESTRLATGGCVGLGCDLYLSSSANSAISCDPCVSVAAARDAASVAVVTGV